MTKISELTVSLGAALTVGAFASYAFLYAQLTHLNALGGMVFFTVSLALLPMVLIGLSVALTNSKYQKFSSSGFKVGAFLLIALLMYVIWVGPSYWLFSLVIGVVTAGLLLALIKLHENTAKLIYTLFGLGVVTFIIVSAYAFVK